MKQLLICNATIVNSDNIQKADVLIEAGKISQIAPIINCQCENTIDASGLLLFPGGIDVHTHMELPVSGTTSSDDFESGTKAALFGGTTTIIDFANQTKGKSPIEAADQWLHKAKGKCYIDYGFHISITDLGKNIEDDIDRLIDEYGISSFKTFLAYPAMELTLEDLDHLMNIVAKRGGLITNHAEVGATIAKLTAHFVKARKISHKKHHKAHPPEIEIEAIKNVVELAIKNQCPSYIVHTSTNKGCEIAIEARKKFDKIYLETCPQYLVFNESLYGKDFEQASKYIMSPPLRSKKDVNGIWKHIQDGNIDVIATDHCPFTCQQKMVGKNDFTKIPNGAPGVENRFELFYHYAVNINKISLTSFVEMIATKPAKLFGIYPQKGEIVVGADADMVLFDPDAIKVISNETHHMNVDYNIYEGQEIKGVIQKVISKGVLAIDGEKCLVEKGRGEYLRRNNHLIPDT